MSTFKQFEDIEAWNSARLLVRQIYRVARRRPMARDFGFRDQICRATLSIMSNIAEGFESGGKANFIRYLNCAKGSAGETRSLLYAALDLEYVSKEEFESLSDIADKSARQIASLISYLKRSDRK